jgi:hypothetical protein
MPNWVYNSIHIDGDKEKVTDLLELLAKPYKGIDNGEVNFLNLVAPPDEHWDAYNCGPIASGSDAEKSPYNWYDWNTRYWGTKWNACGDGGGVVEHTLPDGTLHAHIRFDTAWSPPEPIINALAELVRRSGLTMNYSWEEEQGFGAEYEWHISKHGIGRLVCVEEWDIPQSHADHEKRDRVCVCEWLDSPEEWYGDCPRENVANELDTPNPVSVN